MSEAFGESRAAAERRRCLMEEAAALRLGHFQSAADEAWRCERLYRYLYWREHRAHPGVNLVGGWELPDLEREVERWKKYAKSRLSEEDVVDLIMDELQEIYGKPWAEAVEEGASPLLASINMPIWNEATGSLLPATIGPLAIYNAEPHSSAKLGWSYNYGRAEMDLRLTVVIYNLGFADLEDGLQDPRIGDQFNSSVQDMVRLVEARGGKLLPESFLGPSVERLADSHGREVALVGGYVEADGADGIRRGEALSIRVFRKHFLKVRCSAAAGSADPHGGHLVLDAINADLAEFVVHFA